MKQSSKRLVSGLIALGFIVAALLVFFNLIQPTYGDLQQQKGTEISTQNFLTNEQQTVDQAKKLIRQYKDQGQAQSNLALAMPAGPSVAAALAQVYGIAQNNNVAVQSISVGVPTLVPQTRASGGNASTSVQGAQLVKPMGTFSFQVAAAGGYENFKSFLSQLETNIRIFDLAAFSLQPAQGLAAGGRGAGAASDFFTGNLTVTAYYEFP